MIVGFLSAGPPEPLIMRGFHGKRIFGIIDFPVFLHQGIRQIGHALQRLLQGLLQQLTVHRILMGDFRRIDG